MNTQNNQNDRNKIVVFKNNKSLVEFGADAFSINRAVIHFSAFDTSKPAGQRQTASVSIYLKEDEIRALASLIEHKGSEYIKYCRANDEKTRDYHIWKQMGGTSRKYKKDGDDVVARALTIHAGSKVDFYLTAVEGPGKMSADGGVTFSGTPDKKVSIGLTQNQLLGALQSVIARWNAAIFVDYLTNGIPVRPKREEASTEVTEAPVPEGTTPVLPKQSKDALWEKADGVEEDDLPF